MKLIDLLDKFLHWLIWSPYQLEKHLNMSPSTDNNPQVPVQVEPSNADKFVAAAKAALGQNLSQGTGVPYYVACALSVNVVHHNAFGFPIGGGASTEELYKALISSPYFKKTDTPTPGCVVISPTGFGTKPEYPHGHVGIIGKYGICSNDSSTGIFSENYTVDSWNHQFSTIEGYPVFYFERI